MNTARETSFTKLLKKNLKKHRIFRYLRNKLSNFILQGRKYNPVFDVVLARDNEVSPENIRRALFSYIVHPFLIDEKSPIFLTHINYWHAKEIVKILNTKGYIVDIIDYRDKSFIPNKMYDLFIGHGGINFEKLCSYLPSEAPKIYFSTGCYWKFHNEQELKRVDELNRRKKTNLKPDRFIEFSEEKSLLLADAIIGIGNKRVGDTYHDFPNVIMVNITSRRDNHIEFFPKNIEKGRNNFIFFSGSGCIHKGLDLLLEAFSELEEHLWVCCSIDYEFESVYKNELENRGNIHKMGWIQPRSEEYYQIMDSCNYIIFPSACEGGPASVVECMSLGIIPVITSPSGIDVNGFGRIIDPCSVNEIKKTVKYLVSLSKQQLEEMSRQATLTSWTTYSEDAFKKNFRDALEKALICSGNQ